MLPPLWDIICTGVVACVVCLQLIGETADPSQSILSSTPSPCVTGTISSAKPVPTSPETGKTTLPLFPVSWQTLFVCMYNVCMYVRVRQPVFTYPLCVCMFLCGSLYCIHLPSVCTCMYVRVRQPVFTYPLCACMFVCGSLYSLTLCVCMFVCSSLYSLTLCVCMYVRVQQPVFTYPLCVCMFVCGSLYSLTLCVCMFVCSSLYSLTLCVYVCSCVAACIHLPSVYFFTVACHRACTGSMCDGSWGCVCVRILGVFE